jgi:hypothetical protein
MKAVFIAYNQAHTEVVQAILDKENIKGYSRWEKMQGCGTNGGEPHMGSHAWPAENTSTLAIIEDEKVAPLLKRLRKLDSKSEQQGLRAFVWNIEDGI